MITLYQLVLSLKMVPFSERFIEEVKEPKVSRSYFHAMIGINRAKKDLQVCWEALLMVQDTQSWDR